MSILLIVESPNKIKSITNYLGEDYVVKASVGHIMDLPSDGMNIDIKNNFQPHYEINKDKTQVVNDLIKSYKKCDKVILATDEDREGEFIAYSISQVLGLKNPQRIVFNEISKKALEKAIKNPKTIDMNMVYAQQARRLLDRLVGYQISPIVSKKTNGKSAGRVQSVAVRVVVDKENEIRKSISEPYFKINADFKFKKYLIKSILYSSGKPLHTQDESIGKSLIENINNKTKFFIANMENKTIERSPSTPFTTSLLLQEAFTKLKFKVEDTTRIAQKLYECGYVTYIRTDSISLSEDCLSMCEKYIKSVWSADYYKKRQYQTKSKTAQEAHEAIRPSKIDVVEIKDLDDKHNKLYKLIWDRTIASQMANAKIDQQTLFIDGENNNKSILSKNCFFQANFQKIIFPGFLVVYNNMDDEEELDKTININVKDIVDFNNLICSQEYTKPPLRYNQASIIKQLEKLGIGRPATIPSIIKKISERKYVEVKNIDGVEKESITLNLNDKYEISKKIKKIKIGSEKGKMIPTELGEKVNEFMIDNFDEIMDYKFTAKMEEYLDKIANGKKVWVDVLDKFQKTIEPKIEKMKLVKSDTTIDEFFGDHPDGGKIYKGTGKFGPYLCHVDGNDRKYVSIKDNEDINFDDAIVMLCYPKNLGKIDKEDVILKMGQYGPYCVVGKKNISLKDVKINEINLNMIKQLLNQNKKSSIKIKSRIIDIKEGPYGLYFEYTENKKQVRKTFPKNWNPDKLDLAKVELYLSSQK